MRRSSACSPSSGCSLMKSISSAFTLSKRSSTTSSCFITMRALSLFFSTYASIALISISIVSEAMLLTCSILTLYGLSLLIKMVISLISAAWSPIRSISVTIFIAAEIVLRSLATGCCCMSRLKHRLSIFFCSLSISESPSMMALALSAS